MHAKSPVQKLTKAGASARVVAQANQQVMLVSTDQLSPYRGNARTHTKKQIKQIAASIRKFSFNNPVLIDDDARIIAGHGRVEAAKLLDLPAVPTLRLSHLSPAEQRAYILADNKLAENAGWDRELLAVELQGLIDLDFEVDVTGFEIPEIDLILEHADAGRAADNRPEDRIPEPRPNACVTQPGDLWILGEHRILCGNALAHEDYERLLDGEKAEFIFADPPFDGKGRGKHATTSGDMAKDALTEFLTAALGNLVMHSKDGSIHDICLDWRHLEAMLAAGNNVYSELKNVCVWIKKNGGTESFYRGRHELVFIWKSGTAPHIANFERRQHGRSRTNVWEYSEIARTGATRQEHLSVQTVKPVALVADALRDCSTQGAIVLDPFLGCGTMVIAAERTGRRARGIEIDPVYLDVAIRWWQDDSGKAATLAATGETFEDVAQARTTSKATDPLTSDTRPSDVGEAA
jgi:DNA modification methylase